MNQITLFRDGRLTSADPFLASFGTAQGFVALGRGLRRLAPTVA